MVAIVAIAVVAVAACLAVYVNNGNEKAVITSTVTEIGSYEPVSGCDLR